MDSIQQWAFSICVAMVACGIARMLLPNSGLSKIFSITVSVFFLCSILSPALLRNPSLQIQIEEISREEMERRAQNLTNTLNIQSETALVYRLEKIIAEKLSETGIKYTDIAININTDGQEPSVESVDITLDHSHEEDHESILRELQNTLGLPVRLGYTREER